MDGRIRDTVRERARNHCEYCLAHQQDEPFFRYQVEHIIARQHGGKDESDNLALACPHCNRHKGPNLSGIDPVDGALVPLFNPRRQKWTDHFDMNGALIIGKSPVGRAIVRVLKLNEPTRLVVRLVRRPVVD